VKREAIHIDRRFCGPPDSGNGGYVCGRVAEARRPVAGRELVACTWIDVGDRN
jgi:hypothetical protein